MDLDKVTKETEKGDTIIKKEITPILNAVQSRNVVDTEGLRSIKRQHELKQNWKQRLFMMRILYQTQKVNKVNIR